MWNSSPWVPVCLQGRSLSRTVISLGELRSDLPPQQRQALLEDLASLCSGLVSCNKTWCVWKCRCALLSIIMWETNADTLTVAITMSNELSFPSDPGVSCLPPASMKLWQANVLAYKKDKILDHGQFLPLNLDNDDWQFWTMRSQVCKRYFRVNLQTETTTISLISVFFSFLSEWNWAFWQEFLFSRIETAFSSCPCR